MDFDNFNCCLFLYFDLLLFFLGSSFDNFLLLLYSLQVPLSFVFIYMKHFNACMFKYLLSNHFE